MRLERSHHADLRIKWWHVKDENKKIFQQEILEGGFMLPQGNANDMWDKIANEIKKVAKETLGQSRGFESQDNVLKIGVGVKMLK
jgi:hypothetical protein